MEVSSKVSPISTLDFVREAMVAQQQAMGNEKGIVMDGRDIGTTVFPDAELKIFVTATPEIRAQRRYDELKAKGQEASFDEILENVKQRDYIDQNREVSPLRKAEAGIFVYLYLDHKANYLLTLLNCPKSHSFCSSIDKWVLSRSRASSALRSGLTSRFWSI